MKRSTAMSVYVFNESQVGNIAALRNSHAPEYLITQPTQESGGKSTLRRRCDAKNAAVYTKDPRAFKKEFGVGAKMYSLSLRGRVL